MCGGQFTRTSQSMFKSSLFVFPLVVLLVTSALAQPCVKVKVNKQERELSDSKPVLVEVGSNVSIECASGQVHREGQLVLKKFVFNESSKGLYSCDGCPLRVLLIVEPEVKIDGPETLTVFKGDRSQIPCRLTKTAPNVSYTTIWQFKNGSDGGFTPFKEDKEEGITIADDRSLIFESVTAEQAEHKYRCILEKVNGRKLGREVIQSRPRKLMLIEEPQPNITFKGDQVVCEDATPLPSDVVCLFVEDRNSGEWRKVTCDKDENGEVRKDINKLMEIGGAVVCTVNRTASGSVHKRHFNTNTKRSLDPTSTTSSSMPSSSSDATVRVVAPTAAVLGVIGGVAAVVIVVVILICCWRRNKLKSEDIETGNGNEQEQEVEPTNQNTCSEETVDSPLPVRLPIPGCSPGDGAACAFGQRQHHTQPQYNRECYHGRQNPLFSQPRAPKCIERPNSLSFKPVPTKEDWYPTAVISPVERVHNYVSPTKGRPLPMRRPSTLRIPMHLCYTAWTKPSPVKNKTSSPTPVSIAMASVSLPSNTNRRVSSPALRVATPLEKSIRAEPKVTPSQALLEDRAQYVELTPLSAGRGGKGRNPQLNSDSAVQSASSSQSTSPTQPASRHHVPVYS